MVIDRYYWLNSHGARDKEYHCNSVFYGSGWGTDGFAQCVCARQPKAAQKVRACPHFSKPGLQSTGKLGCVSRVTARTLRGALPPRAAHTSCSYCSELPGLKLVQTQLYATSMLRLMMEEIFEC